MCASGIFNSDMRILAVMPRDPFFFLYSSFPLKYMELGPAIAGAAPANDEARRSCGWRPAGLRDITTCK